MLPIVVVAPALVRPPVTIRVCCKSFAGALDSLPIRVLALSIRISSVPSRPLRVGYASRTPASINVLPLPRHVDSRVRSPFTMSRTVKLHWSNKAGIVGCVSWQCWEPANELPRTLYMLKDLFKQTIKQRSRSHPSTRL